MVPRDEYFSDSTIPNSVFSLSILQKSGVKAILLCIRMMYHCMLALLLIAEQL